MPSRQALLRSLVCLGVEFFDLGDDGLHECLHGGLAMGTRGGAKKRFGPHLACAELDKPPVKRIIRVAGRCASVSARVGLAAQRFDADVHALVTGLLFAIGVLALSRPTEFLYFQF